jgi:hypothetical protein
VTLNNLKGRKETPEEAAQRCAETLARRRTEGGKKLRPAAPTAAAPDYTVSTPDVGEWRGRYFVMTVPTSSSLSNRGASTVTKHSARTRR